jgi:hypothetical protein
LIRLDGFFISPDNTIYFTNDKVIADIALFLLNFLRKGNL